METAILTIQCIDKPGIVATISNWIFNNGGNIICSDQYSSHDDPQDIFFMRVEFTFSPSKIQPAELEQDFNSVATKLAANWSLHYRSQKLKMGILVSKHGHCLFDLLYHVYSKDLVVEIPFIISNHPDTEFLANKFSIPFYHLPVNSKNKEQQEQKIIEYVKETTDFLVLARYMQILSPQFLAQYSNEIINIHHSFLPSFIGANPYMQAYQRGVKIIGATAHYVTQDLDEGPIITQMVENVSHRDDVITLQKKGKNLEKLTLSKAVEKHINHQVIRYGNKTIVFD